MSRSLKALVSPAAIKHNLQVVKNLVPSTTKILAMIKANGYGHDLLIAAKALEQADALGVACIEEAIQLRQAGIKQAIVLMQGFFAASELKLINKFNLNFVIHNEEQLRCINNFKQNIIPSCWLKVDTGMHRLGFLPEDLSSIIRQIKNNCNVDYKNFKSDCKLKIQGLMTHMANADDIDNNYTNEQMDKFYTVLNALNYVNNKSISIANSATILTRPDLHADWVRPGIMLYGVSPLINNNEESRYNKEHDFKLLPAMTLQAEIIAIKQVKLGDGIGYGSRFISNETMQIGIISIGYGDGYPANTPDGTPVLVNGKLSRIVGRVSMDMLAVDLTNVINSKIGDTVTLWGEGLPIEKVAHAIGIIPYELLTRLNIRVERVVTEDFRCFT